jgi:hypothetical protein
MTELMKEDDGRDEKQERDHVVDKRAADVEQRSDHFTPTPSFVC